MSNDPTPARDAVAVQRWQMWCEFSHGHRPQKHPDGAFVEYADHIVALKAAYDKGATAALAAERERGIEEALPLARLGLAALEVASDGGDYDGSDIADLAEELGVVVRTPIIDGQYCDEGCPCADVAADYCLRDTPATKAIRALAALTDAAGRVG